MSPAPRSTDGVAIEPTLAKGIYEWLRERIIDGTLKPGERIRERELAEKLKVSRIPIRGSPAPAGERRVRHHDSASRGHRYADGSAGRGRTVRSPFQLGGPGAEARRGRCAQGADTAALSACLAEAEEAVAEGQPPDRRGESRLHEEILKLTGNALLQHVMVPISGRVQRLFHIVTERDHEAVHAEHVALCKAILAGKSELAEAGPSSTSRSAIRKPPRSSPSSQRLRLRDQPADQRLRALCAGRSKGTPRVRGPLAACRKSRRPEGGP